MQLLKNNLNRDENVIKKTKLKIKKRKYIVIILLQFFFLY